MRVPGRYSPAPGTHLDEIPYFEHSPTKPLQQRNKFIFALQWLRRRSRILAFAAIAWLLIHYLRTRSNPSTVNWSRYAYSQYATSSAYLCNTLMVFDSLHRLGSRADRILFYPHSWDTAVSSKYDRDSQLLVLARDKYRVKLMPVDIPDARALLASDANVFNGEGEGTWDNSAAKLMAFGETQYDRILHVDSDITLLKNLDKLFFLPSAPVAMPRAYWVDDKTPKPLTSLIVLLEPSAREFNALVNASWNVPKRSHRYDMELLNERYAESALVLPHRPYLLTGELRRGEHSAYLEVEEEEEWDVDRVVGEASLVHFSDWPLPKPWVMWPMEGMKALRPRCKVKPGTAEESGCRERELWTSFYDDFRKRRKDVCRLLSEPAPNWPPKGVNMTGL